MKIYKVIIVLAFCTFFNGFTYSQDYDSLNYRKVWTPRIFLDTNVIFIVNDSIKFEGYMVFKINKNDSYYPKKSGKSLIVIESYFVRNINDIENPERILYFTTDHNFYDLYFSCEMMEAPVDTNNYWTKRVINFINSNEFKEFKNLYYKNYPIKEKSRGYFLDEPITTEIFFDSTVTFLNLGNCDSIGFFIYKCSFSTAVLRFTASLVIDKDKTGQLIPQILNVLLPISPLYYFKPINENEYSLNGFKKANLFPEILKK